MEGDAEGQSGNDLCSSVDDMKQKRRRDEGEEGRHTEQGGLRKQLVRMIQRRARRRAEQDGERRGERRWWKEVEEGEVQEIDERE